MQRQQSLAFLALFVTMLIWGLSAVYMRKTALELTAENSLAFRYMILAIIFIPGLLITGSWRIAATDWPRLLVTAFVGMLGYNWFITEGFLRVAAGFATVITTVEPLFIAILAWLLLREKLTASIYLGIAVSIAGALILCWPDLLKQTNTPMSWWGVTCLVIGCLAWAIYTIVGKPLLERYSSFAITAWTMLLSTPVLWSLSTKPMLAIAQDMTGQQWAEIIFLALGSGLAGTMLWNYGARHLPGALTGSFLYLIPVIAVVAAWFILAEPITAHLVVGGMVMLAGVAIAQFGPVLIGRKAANAN